MTPGLVLLNPPRPARTADLPGIRGRAHRRRLQKGVLTVDIGEKLRLLRQQRNLTQEEVADRCELSKGFISQVERNLASPSIATLTDLLQCLGTNLKDFFSDSGNDKVVFSREDMFVKEDGETLKGSITWLVPSAQKNRMEPILVDLGPAAPLTNWAPTKERNSDTSCRGPWSFIWAKGAIPSAPGKASASIPAPTIP